MQPQDLGDPGAQMISSAGRSPASLKLGIANGDATCCSRQDYLAIGWRDTVARVIGGRLERRGECSDGQRALA